MLGSQGAQVSGPFTHANPVYNGTLTGALNGNTLAFSTAQPNFSTGKGEFVLSASGCKIDGRFWMDQDPGKTYAWSGVRVN